MIVKDCIKRRLFLSTLYVACQWNFGRNVKNTIMGSLCRRVFENQLNFLLSIFSGLRKRSGVVLFMLIYPHNTLKGDR